MHVLFRREELDPARVQDRVVVVLDVLFATSSILHVLAHGASRVWPARDAAHARRIAGVLDRPLLAGEHMARPIAGFAAATPLALAAGCVPGADVVYATTNGTVTLDDLAGARQVYAGALLNGRALASHLARHHPGATVLLLCAGSASRFNLEDFYGAGHIAAHLDALGGYALSDAARAAMLLARGCDARSALSASRVGMYMASLGLQGEVDRAAQQDVLDVVARLRDGCLEAVA